jgi:hypothetical protein
VRNGAQRIGRGLAVACAFALSGMFMTSGFASEAAAAAAQATPIRCNPLVAGMTRRTSSITLSCRDRVDVLSRLTWTSWKPSAAIGHGTFVYTSCDPKCASGERRTTHALVRLSRPVEKEGIMAFTRVRVTFTDAVGNRVVKVYRAAVLPRARSAGRS